MKIISRMITIKEPKLDTENLLICKTKEVVEINKDEKTGKFNKISKDGKYAICERRAMCFVNVLTGEQYEIHAYFCDDVGKKYVVTAQHFPKVYKTIYKKMSNKQIQEVLNDLNGGKSVEELSSEC